MPSADKTPGFNPLIHGTNSAIFAMLPHTKLKIISTMKMLTEYQMAPLCGEVGDSLYGGGLGLHSDPYISFGRMNASYFNYGLERIINSYSIITVASSQDAIKKFHDKFNFTRSRGYEDINILLVYLSRAKILGVFLEQEEYAQIEKSVKAVIDYHYFLFLLVKYVRTNLVLLKEHIIQPSESLKTLEQARSNHEDILQQMSEDVRNTMPAFNYDKYLSGAYEYFLDEKFCEYFNYEKLLNKIAEKKINLKAVYENPTPENLQKVLSLLSFSTAKDSDASASSSKIPFFIQTDPRENVQRGSPFSLTDIHRIYTEPSQKTLPNLIDKFTQGKGASNFALFEEVTLQRAKVLEDKLALMKKIIDRKPITFNDNQKRFIDKPFPVILVSEAESKVKMVDQEYRAQEDITLGEDISMIATDTTEHQKEVMNFLLENHIDNVQVVLFEQLKQSQVNGERPILDLEPPQSFGYQLR